VEKTTKNDNLKVQEGLLGTRKGAIGRRKRR
jgi:hypothetical protein